MDSAIAATERRRPILGLGVVHVWLFIAAVAAASAGLWAYNLATFGPPRAGGLSVPWWVLAVAFGLSEAYVVHLHFRKQAHTLSASEIGLVLGLFFASPAAVLAGQVVGAGSSSCSTWLRCRCAAAWCS